jgi:hypothetical protein
MAEQNYRKYGWPIPQHLQTSVAAIAPDLKRTFNPTSSPHGTVGGADSPADTEHSNRLAAGQGKLQEVDLGPDAALRTEQAWKRLDNGEPEPPASKARRDKYGYAWRKPKRNGKTDEDIRRDQMVEAILSEAKRTSCSHHPYLRSFYLIPSFPYTNASQSTTSTPPPPRNP